MKYTSVTFVGFGSTGQGLLPLVFKHLEYITPSDISIIAADSDGNSIASSYAVEKYFPNTVIDSTNYQEILSNHVKPGGLLINVSVNVCSKSLIAWCFANNVNYIDTCLEPWSGGYHDSDVVNTTNFKAREDVLQMQQKGAPTAVIAHGANPGLVTHFVKEYLSIRAVDTNESWSEISERLGIRIVQIAERDTQTASSVVYQAGDFVNTWSVDGFTSECYQRGEMGWGSHETDSTNVNKFPSSKNIGRYHQHSSAEINIKSFVPSCGEHVAKLITHHEAFSITEMLNNSKTGYQPTVYYAYKPCELAERSLVDWLANNKQVLGTKRVIKREIDGGFDELGVLMISDQQWSVWYGSTLSNEEARSLVPHNSATTLQVTSTMIAAIMWIAENPNEGIVEAENIDTTFVLKIAKPYLGRIACVYNGWTNNNQYNFESYIA